MDSVRANKKTTLIRLDKKCRVCNKIPEHGYYLSSIRNRDYICTECVYSQRRRYDPPFVQERIAAMKLEKLKTIPRAVLVCSVGDVDAGTALNFICTKYQPDAVMTSHNGSSCSTHMRFGKLHKHIHLGAGVCWPSVKNVFIGKESIINFEGFRREVREYLSERKITLNVHPKATVSVGGALDKYVGIEKYRQNLDISTRILIEGVPGKSPREVAAGVGVSYQLINKVFCVVRGTRFDEAEVEAGLKGIRLPAILLVFYEDSVNKILKESIVSAVNRIVQSGTRRRRPRNYVAAIIYGNGEVEPLQRIALNLDVRKGNDETVKERGTDDGK